MSFIQDWFTANFTVKLLDVIRDAPRYCISLIPAASSKGKGILRLPSDKRKQFHFTEVNNSWQHKRTTHFVKGEKLSRGDLLRDFVLESGSVISFRPQTLANK